MEQKVKFRISSYQTAIKKSLNHFSEIKRILKSLAVDSDEYKKILNSEYIYYPIQTENKRQVQIYSR